MTFKCSTSAKSSRQFKEQRSFETYRPLTIDSIQYFEKYQACQFTKKHGAGLEKGVIKIFFNAITSHRFYCICPSTKDKLLVKG